MARQPPADIALEMTPCPTAEPGGGAATLDRLVVRVHHELSRLARRHLVRERTDHTLDTAALVNETYLKLAQQEHVQWVSRDQFFALASRAMRRILIDYARRHRRLRDRVAYDSNAATDGESGSPPAIQLAATQRADYLLALDEALERLFMRDERLGRVVEYRFFSGYTEGETAALLGVTPRTVARDWVKAKSLLYADLRESLGP